MTFRKPVKTPAPPPHTTQLLDAAASRGRLVELISKTQSAMQGEYLSWDKLRQLAPPSGLTTEEWWLSMKIGRRAVMREIPLLRDQDQGPFWYTLPDRLLQGVDSVSRGAGGSISFGEQVTSPALRDRYIVSSLIEEAITSSQLEGAVTSRRVAKEMLREGRAPRDRSEKMILNSYRAMSEVRALTKETLTPELVCHVHRIVTEGTLDDPTAAGAIQTDQGKRVSVWGDGDQLLYRPPNVEELPERLERLCSLANPGARSDYLPPLLRSIALHFMFGYDHYFEDGNGRTARALFYWSMLREGFWLTEFLTISHILRQAPAQYARSFLLTEDDEGDLTHFFLFHVAVVERAIENLHRYLAGKAEELREVQQRISNRRGEFNHRQLALLEAALKDRSGRYTARSHALSHAVSKVTARHDLQGLEQMGLLQSRLAGREQVWTPVAGLEGRL